MMPTRQAGRGSYLRAPFTAVGASRLLLGCFRSSQIALVLSARLTAALRKRQRFVDGLPKGSCPTLCYCSRSVPNGSAAQRRMLYAATPVSLPSSGPVRHYHLAIFVHEPADVGIQKDDEHRLRRSQTKRSQPRGCRPLLNLDGHGCPGAFWGAAAGGRP